MSLIVTVFVREGIVMAADSRLTLESNRQQGGQQLVKLAVSLTDSVQKCFLAPGSVGIATYGAADIGGVPISGYIESFIAERLTGGGHTVDIVDMSSSRVADKFALAGLTRGAATLVNAPTIEEAPIQLECRVSHVLRVPPARTVYLADVVATTVHEASATTTDGSLWPRLRSWA